MQSKQQRSPSLRADLPLYSFVIQRYQNLRVEARVIKVEKHHQKTLSVNATTKEVAAILDVKKLIDIKGLFHSTAELAGKVEEQVNESIGLSKGLIGKAVHSGLNQGL